MYHYERLLSVASGRVCKSTIRSIRSISTIRSPVHGYETLPLGYCRVYLNTTSFNASPGCVQLWSNVLSLPALQLEVDELVYGHKPKG